MKKTSLMNGDSCSFSKSSFGCYFRRSLVNFKTYSFLEHMNYSYMVHEKVEVLCLIRNI